MLFCLAYSLARSLAELCLVRTGSDAQLRAEVLAVRHQLRVLERKLGKPRWQPGDRILLVALSRLLPKSGCPALRPFCVGIVTSFTASGPPITATLVGPANLAT